MTHRDIPAGIRLCRAAAWNQLESDWSLLLNLNPAGCCVAEQAGEVIGTVASIPYENRFSWLAMVLVDPRRRRMGVGTKLLEEGLALAGQQTCVRLDATDTGRQIYLPYGFTDECTISRLTLYVGSIQTGELCGQARGIRPDDFPRILDVDRAVFGADRESVLRSLFSRSPECAWVVQDPDIKGYCFGRDGFLYHQIGPVVAEDEAIAQALVLHCLRAGSERPYVVDARYRSAQWIEWLEMKGFVKERSFTRMFRGENGHPGEPQRVFAVAGPELG